MAYSIYEVDGAQDLYKPSDVIESPDYLLQDVFFQTRPDLFNYRGDPGEGNPYYKNFRDDESIKEQEKSDFRYVFNPEFWTQQSPPLVNPYKRYDVSRPYDLKKLVSFYRLENDPLKITYSFNDRSAASMEDLIRATSDFSTRNAPHSNARLIKSDPKNAMWTYRVVSFMKNSDPRGHIVTVTLVKDPKQRDLRKLEIQLGCSCPFWKWWGPDYNAKNEDYLKGKPRSDGSAPEKRDPERRNKICKHVYVVGQVFERFAKKYELDTFREVDKIVDVMEKLEEESDRLEMEDVKEITKFLDRDEKLKIEKFLRKYELEKNEKRKINIRKDTLEELTRILAGKEKRNLQKIEQDIANFGRKILRKKSSLENVIEIYRSI